MSVGSNTDREQTPSAASSSADAATSIGSSSGTASAGGGAAESQAKISLTAQIAALKQAQREAKDMKTKATKELRNAKRRKSRLVKKAKQLTTDDLAAVLECRQEAKSQRIEAPDAAAAAVVAPAELDAAD
jgi:hypothetical protein